MTATANSAAYTAQWVWVACTNCGRQHKALIMMGSAVECVCPCGAIITVRGAR